MVHVRLLSKRLVASHEHHSRITSPYGTIAIGLPDDEANIAYLNERDKPLAA
jgi:hypothetical protein